jgi:NAD(P)-dependent dehydrogenase (short-subunit alcohol dehydrogenase family)
MRRTRRAPPVEEAAASMNERFTGRVAGKKAVITGGAGGLGTATAKLLAAHGAKVFLTDANSEGARRVASEIERDHGPGVAFAADAHDVRDEARWIEVLAEANAAMGGISVLVNNAGVGSIGNVEAVTMAEWRRVMDINVDGIFLGSKHALAYMRDHQPGSIVNISSIAGLIASHNFPAYNASKAGAWMLSKSIALHCAHERIDVRSNSIHPAFIRTGIVEPIFAALGEEAAMKRLSQQIPLGHLGEPDDVAYMVLFLASDESKFVTAAEFKVDGGISAGV